jgi:putative ABC transport system ATP-binding protein
MEDPHASGTDPGRASPGGRALNPGGSEQTVLRVVDLTRVYGSGDNAVRALRSVSFDVPAGDMVCITGKSGSGKSTLLRQLGLLDLPTSGRVVLDGIDVTSVPERRRRVLRLERLGYVFQEYALLAELTAEENVYLPAMMLGRSRRDCRDRATELLATFDLADRRRHRPSELSGGQQQRVAIARALMNEPAVLLADEPTGNLDSVSTATVMEALARTNEEFGVTILFVSHDPDHSRYSKHQIDLRDGALTETV